LPQARQSNSKIGIIGLYPNLTVESSIIWRVKVDLTLTSAKKLNNGVDIPLLGFGVWEVPNNVMGLRAMLDALEAGYRHIDTAAFYANEPTVGAAVRQSGLDRSKVFVTTKVWNSDHGYQQTLRACEESLRRLQFDYVDLYLIHWPVPEARLETWRALEKLLNAGRARAVGVSNYMLTHLHELLENYDIVPAVNQFELHPYNYLRRYEVIDYCRANNIAVEAYCPLARGARLNDPRLRQVADENAKSPAQIMVRWSLQHGNIVIPKSVHRDRIFANADVFDFALDNDDMTLIDSLNENLVTTWDPTGAP